MQIQKIVFYDIFNEFMKMNKTQDFHMKCHLCMWPICCPVNAFRRYGNRMSKFGSTSMHEFGVGGAVFSFTWGLAVAEAAAAKTVDGVGCAGATCCCMVAFWKQVWSLTLILNQLFISRKDTTHNVFSTDVCQTYSTKFLALPWKRNLKKGREVPMKLDSWD